MKSHQKSDLTTCKGGRLERPRYFPRQLITPEEMNLGQDYFRQRLRLHNRMLHGWGVVCGALVCPVPKADLSGPEPWKVAVKPGYALGPCGNEICIDCDHVVDLRTCGLSSAPGEPPEQSADPWCSDVFVKREGGPVWVAVKYEECMTRPTRAQPVACGCDDTSCEFSRWRDGYVLGVLDDCPESHQCGVAAPDRPDCSQICQGPNPHCPPCPEDLWVVLAGVGLHEDGTIDWIDNCSCRRLVASPGGLWWRCDDAQHEGPIMIHDVVVEGSATPGSEVTIGVHGHNFSDADNAHFNNDSIELQTRVLASENEISFRFWIKEDVEPGHYSLVIESSNETVATYKNALKISPLPPVPSAAKKAAAKKVAAKKASAKKAAKKRADAKKAK